MKLPVTRAGPGSSINGFEDFQSEHGIARAAACRDAACWYYTDHSVNTFGKEGVEMSFALDYDQWIHLDAEDLAETGIGEAYERLLPELRKYVPQPARVEEVIDNDAPSYSVRCATKEHSIDGPDLDDGIGNSWGRASFAFFSIVNDQLATSEYRLYAINGGNDLGGMFLTTAQARESRDSLPNRTDWPYLPTDEDPWYGQYH
jgi:hypothetical protein